MMCNLGIMISHSLAGLYSGGSQNCQPMFKSSPSFYQLYAGQPLTQHLPPLLPAPPYIIFLQVLKPRPQLPKMIIKTLSIYPQVKKQRILIWKQSLFIIHPGAHSQSSNTFLCWTKCHKTCRVEGGEGQVWQDWLVWRWLRWEALSGWAEIPNHLWADGQGEGAGRACSELWLWLSVSPVSLLAS